MSYQAANESKRVYFKRMNGDKPRKQNWLAVKPKWINDRLVKKKLEKKEQH